MRQGGAIASGEVVAELELVFLRLSAIDLCQARCVCREWRRAIDDPIFRKGYALSHRCIPHLFFRLSGSLLVKPLDNSPRSEWRHFQKLPKGMTIASSDAGLLCLVKWWAPSSIFVWRYSDLNSSPVRVPLPPETGPDMRLTVYRRERDRSTREFCVASFGSSLGFYIYDSVSGEWSLRENKHYPDTRDMDNGDGFYPILDHGEVVMLCTDAFVRYNLWDDSWRILKLDSDELQFEWRWFFLQLVVVERRGEKCFEP
ncbi:uncharacterized protein LOC112349304 [Selaginella moellendorffii]|uniref:uncharacterized protein LOC112349304 n=1 Tax=Selaginella moellendorffii TaxID=88036 RepID=UPI000D1C8DEA|nr:uncharacterized protein LOC112349304 [Selaginella moellendorffii]|eukprot:XP_024539310.1 uncharacterized protein LOC112349304 [Selaginella moellendorffii]